MRAMRYYREDLPTGMMRAAWDMFNQHGEKVLHMQGYGMFRGRQSAGAEELARPANTREQG